MRFFKWIVIMAFAGGLGWLGWQWYTAREISGEALALIPRNAVYCITTDDPVESWKEIASSRAWSHLQKNAYFASLTQSANHLDSLIRDNDLLFDLIGSHSLIVSAHMTGYKTYDFLFLIDLKEVSGIKFLQDYITHFSTEGISISKEKHGADELLTLYNSADKSRLYVSMPGSFLIASYTRKLMIDALDARAANDSLTWQSIMKKEPGLGDRGLAQLYVNYTMLPRFMGCYASGPNEYVNRIGQALQATSLSVSLQDELLLASGHTSIQDSVESYIKTLAVSGKGRDEVLEIAPQRTAFLLRLGFNSFAEFFANFQENIQHDVGEYAAWREDFRQIENYLNISIEKNFVNWIGDEVALMELQSSGKGIDRETALVLKASNIGQATRDLEHIEKMIRRRTPVKFKSVDHRGYTIRYLSMKGMFKVLLGKFFARYDKPYFTVLNNFVIFSNHPQTLESIIDDYLDQKTLDRSDEFREFNRHFEEESSVSIYVNTPVLFNSIKKLASESSRASMENNKDYITCFRHIGFQLVPEAGGFKTTLAEQFAEPTVPPVLTAEPPALRSDTGKVETVYATTEGSVPEDTDPMALPYIYVRDLSTSTFRDYFADSTLHFEVDLKNGFKDGAFTEYHPNGEVKMKGHFRRDKRDGTWRLFDTEGNLILKRVYDENVIKKEITRE